jgi:hypothetical protein
MQRALMWLNLFGRQAVCRKDNLLLQVPFCVFSPFLSFRRRATLMPFVSIYCTNLKNQSLEKKNKKKIKLGESTIIG